MIPDCIASNIVPTSVHHPKALPISNTAATNKAIAAIIARIGHKAAPSAIAKPPNANVAPSAAAASVVIPIAAAALAIAPSPSIKFLAVCAMLKLLIQVIVPLNALRNCVKPCTCKPN